MNGVFVRGAFALAGGVPLLAVSALLMVMWISPGSVGGVSWLKLGAMMVVLEFLLLHSGTFMAVGPSVCKKPWQQVAWFFGFAAFSIFSLSA